VLTNPIIRKEFLQAGRRVRTYLFRCGLAATAFLLIGPRLWESLSQYGQDWRGIARMARSVFNTLAWFQILALPTISFLLCSMTLREEWNNRTLEVLCASPLSRFQIVYGKFVAAVGKLVLAALALLPIMAVLLHLGRVPRHMVLGTFGLIVSTTLLTGALGLLQAALYRPGRYGWMNWFIIVVPYFLIILLAAILFDAEAMVAALPIPAIDCILFDRVPHGMPVVWFAALACSINTIVAFVALAFAPRFFAASLARHYEPRPERDRRLVPLRKWFSGTRPAWDAEEAGETGWYAFLRAHPVCMASLGRIIVFVLCCAFLFWALSNRTYIYIMGLGSTLALTALGFLYTLCSPGSPNARGIMPAIRGTYSFFRYTLIAVLVLLVPLLHMDNASRLVWPARSPWAYVFSVLAVLAPGIGAVAGTVPRRLGMSFRLKPDPFAWQERGGPTAALRRLPWAVYAVVFLVALTAAISKGDAHFLTDDDFYGMLLGVGLTMFGLLSLFYGLWVFSREKSRRRSEILLLTGCTPWRFVWAKIRALYAALWLPLLSIPVIVLGFLYNAPLQYLDWEDYLLLTFLIGQGVIFGPALCAVIGMGFGLAGRGTARAALGLISSAAWGFLLFWPIGLFVVVLNTNIEHIWWLFLLGFGTAAWMVVRIPRRLTPWHLGLSLALQFYLVVFFMIAAVEMTEASFLDSSFVFVISAAGSLGAWLVCFAWLARVLKMFDRGMARDAVSLRRR